MNAKPISETKNPVGQTGCVVAIALIFFCAGMGMLIGFAILPWLNCRASSDWLEVPCTIVSSAVEVHRGDDSNSYSVEAEFAYEVNQQKFVSDQYDFNTTKRSRKKCKEIVRLLPAGKETVCYVDPDAPENAVLNREFLTPWLEMLMGLIFSVLGAVVAFGFSMSMGRRKKLTRTMSPQGGFEAVNSLKPIDSNSTGLFPEDLEDQKWDVPQRLKPKMTRVGTLTGMIFIALFWNGIVSVFVWQTFANFNLDFFSIFMLLFMIPFLIVGLLIILGVVKAFLGLFNPVFEIAMSTGAVARGSGVDVAWEIKGNPNRINRLRIVAVGTESAEYQQGTDTVTATSEFELLPIADTTETQEISFGNATVTIPNETMHTFADRHNKVEWAIQLRADVARFPDVFQTHTFRVKP